MTALQPFVFPESGQPVRTVMIDGLPWFVATDVCRVLGHTDPSVALRMLDDDERRTLRRSRRSDTPYFEHPSIDQRVQALAVICESGLYTLALRSNVAGAKAFKAWITREVLPALRATGTYSLGADQTSQLSLTDLSPAALRVLADERDRAERAELQLARALPMSSAYRDLASKEGALELVEVALVLAPITGGLGRTGMIRELRAMNIFQKRKPIPYARHLRHFAVKCDAHGRQLGSTTVVPFDGVVWLRARFIKRRNPQQVLFEIGGAA